MGCRRSNNSSSSDFINRVNVAIGLFSFIAYLLNQIILKKTNWTFFTNYFNDLLAPIILLAFTNFLLNFYNKELKGKYIYLFIGLCGVFWEFVTPLYKTTSVCDILDIVMYILGASIYIIVRFLIVRRCSRWKIKK